MKNILIFGAGSIGNHMSFAATKLGFKVYITDINPLALERMRSKIYPKRYGKWNKEISQIEFNKIVKLNKNFDLIIIGTPPNTHLSILKFCEKNLKFKKTLIEKPLCVFNQNLNFIKKKKKYQIFVGYNHSVSPSFQYFLKYLNKINKKVLSIEVLWKEGWSGILGAHFWMKNEFDSYLGQIKLGGGALHEHSHGLHLLILILKKLKIDYSKFLISKKIYYKNYKKKKYDTYASFTSTANNVLIKYETDLLTFPSQKEIIINYKNSSLKWICNVKNGKDMVVRKNTEFSSTKKFSKTRSSEFENELKHIMNYGKKIYTSNIDIKYSLDVIKLIKKII
tara:strand:+ start:972 stop:1982 length:1011 start_codon:yes stop_codon:yes gene_type:complete